ncbi:flagellar hook assembly protein FlgD [Bacillus massiliigorillae]|uniref:flagellar hook assembly protein FlgD n=1 Tax=Bacillus massiliigorillae TaxID=1243664 RepID=UPI0003A50726|nr:flagellar hook assembly protein FlgD [Bacillus massiliigorillae]
MAGIDPSYMLSNYQNQQRKNNGSALGKDEFLKILMVQLQNQDPMSPMEDKDFIAQMAQFSTLEQITNMASSFEKLADAQMQSQLIAYNEFVGKEVKWHKISYGEKTEEYPDGTPSIQEGTGKISKVQYKDGSVVFELEDGTKLEPANISEILSPGSVSSGGASNNLMQASELIGKIVSWQKDEHEQAGTVKSVSYKDGKVMYELTDGTQLTANQITKIAAD